MGGGGEPLGAAEEREIGRRGAHLSLSLSLALAGYCLLGRGGASDQQVFNKKNKIKIKIKNKQTNKQAKVWFGATVDDEGGEGFCSTSPHSTWHGVTCWERTWPSFLLLSLYTHFNSLYFHTHSHGEEDGE